MTKKERKKKNAYRFFICFSKSDNTFQIQKSMNKCCLMWKSTCSELFFFEQFDWLIFKVRAKCDKVEAKKKHFVLQKTVTTYNVFYNYELENVKRGLQIS